MVTVCPSQFATRRTLFHVLVGCGLLMLKVSRLKLPVIWLLVSMWLNTLTRSEERFSRNAETDLVCRLLLEKKKKEIHARPAEIRSRIHAPRANPETTCPAGNQLWIPDSAYRTAARRA